jgi:hypothetical protein
MLSNWHLNQEEGGLLAPSNEEVWQKFQLLKCKLILSAYIFIRQHENLPCGFFFRGRI